MIVSASYRTDIPAFYPAWFRARFRAGWARVVNPYGGPPGRVALRAGVDGFVFWTRNPAPFLDVLDEVRAAGLPFVVQMTLTGYPKVLEPHGVAPARGVALLHEIAARHGRRAVVWRYDPIVIAAPTPLAWHEDNFAGLAAAVAGAVDEVVVSFATYYAKTRRHLARAGVAGWQAPAAAERQGIAAGLARVARGHAMRLSTCSQPDGLGEGVSAARCVDAARLTDVAAGWGLLRPIAARPKGNRPGCGCVESRDIGAYDTCVAGCAYCYAVNDPARARAARAAHDPAADSLSPDDSAAGADEAQPRLL